MLDISCLSGVELNCHPKTIKNTSVHLFLHYENISTYWESTLHTFQHYFTENGSQLTNKYTNPNFLLVLGLSEIRKKKRNTGKIYRQSLFFKTFRVLTPALGQAVNVTAFAWSNKNGVLHQGNRVGQSLAHSHTFKSWNNKQSPSRTDNQTLSHFERCEDQCRVEQSGAEFISPVSTSVTKHSSKRNRVSK